MYLSNTRLISLLLALAALTLGLLWLLSKQVNLTAPTALNAQESTQLAARQPDIHVPDQAVTAIPDLEPAKKLDASAVVQAAAAASQAKAGEQSAASKVETKPVENLVLSEKELKALSAKDRQRYEKMLENLRSLRDQSTQLTTERQRLELQMNQLEQRNLELTKQLEQTRQTAETTVENKTKP